MLSVSCAFLLATLMCGLQFIVDTKISWADIFYIWLYCLVWALVVEVVKLMVEGLNLDNVDDGHVPAAGDHGASTRSGFASCWHVLRIADARRPKYGRASVWGV